MRIDDLDGPRIKPQAAPQLLEDLRWLGIDWDIGPVFQSQQLSHYATAIQLLLNTNSAYPCVCTRTEIERAASAPHAEDGSVVYNGACRDKFSSVEDARLAAGRAPALRFRVPTNELQFFDELRGPLCINPAGQLGDFVVAKADGTPAYQLASAVDDASMGITDVVRGDDLLDSTPRQILLMNALYRGRKLPRYWHLPLVIGADGRRLAKRHGDSRLSRYRAAGVPPTRVLAYLARSCAMDVSDAPTTDELLAAFDLRNLPRTPVIFTPAEDQALLSHGDRQP